MRNEDRLLTPDVLRGLAVVMMVLDHTRYFFLDRSLDLYPAAGHKISVFLLLMNSQVVTSIFLLLAGASVGLSLSKFSSPNKARTFLLIRGITLALFELTIVHLLWRFNFYPNFVHIEAIFIIGVGIASLGLLQYLPRKILLLIVIGVFFGHNLLDSYQLGGAFWTLFKTGGKYQMSSITLSVSYPLLPWVPVVWCGFLISELLNSQTGNVRLRALGIVCIFGFTILRSLGLYGDPTGWMPSDSNLTSLASFWGTFKYGGSIQHHLWTLGLIFFLLSFDLTGIRGKMDFLVKLGRRSLISYTAHLLLLHSLALLIYYCLGHDTGFLFTVSPRRFMPIGIGFSAYSVTIIFLAVLCITFWVAMLVSPDRNGSRKRYFKYL